MLFNSYAFLLVFLPVVAGGSFLLARRRSSLAVAWVAAASFAFYAWWDIRFVPLLAGSVLFNWLAGRAIADRGSEGERGLRAMLAMAIAANLGLLGWFKYAGFLGGNLDALLGIQLAIPEVVLPLGISFFTFTQIAYLVDMYRAPARYGIVPYALFVTYFPHLIAGPILHHREMMPQFAAPTAWRANPDNVAAGVTIFAIGLFKKVVLADGIAPFAGPVFGAAAQGYAPGFLEAWGAALAYGLQLYFDFSGYCDMAIGVSKMLGVRLPVNFESPYKATSIIEFWRRWHMTLSRFLRDYLYIPLGGSRHGATRHMVNLLTTMVLGGLWHGAAWTFVLWGTVHGIFLAINHGWRAMRARIGPQAGTILRIEHAIGAGLTFVAVFAAWVLFRADDLASAGQILRGMAGLNGARVPEAWLATLGELLKWAFGSRFGSWIPHALLPDWIMLRAAELPIRLADAETGDALVSRNQLLWIAALLGLSWLAPNTRQIMAHADAVIADRRVAVRATRFVWRPGLAWAAACVGLLLASLLGMARVSEFLYFQF